MPRCVICDSCSETGTGSEVTRRYVFKEKENGYVCQFCLDAVADQLADFEIETLELGGSDILEAPGLAEDTEGYHEGEVV